jgi:hypothetical protein
MAIQIINPFEAATFANNPPADPLRKAARSIDQGTLFAPAQLHWIESHDWFDSMVCNRVVVVDHFTYEGRSYCEKIIWGGTFAELRNWAGY